MKTRGRAAAKKRSAADLLVSPPQGAANTSNQSTESPKSLEFKLNSPMATTVTAAGNRCRSVPPVVDSSPIRSKATVSSIDELKEMASSQLDWIKRRAERSHSDILKEVESSHSRLHKRCKIQTQACQQMMDAIDKEFKKMSERITESCEAMKGSYAEFIVEAQTTTARVCKTFIPEKVQSLEKAIDALRSRNELHQTEDVASQTSWKKSVEILVFSNHAKNKKR
ncbi:hypothetical protein Cgig2_030828 [Carnegiea gigantea]|uniref:Uncharacterized protein n=1 Tax=Carnegiea gigantea TaxID=171969 RepID=A0A9Q1JGN1_9CARY|nr:hypothetical protein Cgig2_030828 [Carnegiea gigantea]